MAESALEQAVREAAAGGSQARRRVYELLAQDSLYVEASHPPGGAVTLSTATKGGRLEMSVFTSMESALRSNPDAEAYRVHAPSSWIFLEAKRLGCAAVWINPPQCEILSADFAALASGLVPGDAPKIVSVSTQRLPLFVPPASVPPASVPPVPAPPVPAPPVPAPPALRPPPFVPRPSVPQEDAPVILAPGNPVPKEALDYLPVAMGAVAEVSAAYLFDLVMPGEPRMLCLGLRIDLPSSEWNGFIEAIDQLDEIPGFPNGVAVYPLNDEMLETAREVGVKILSTRE